MERANTYALIRKLLITGTATLLALLMTGCGDDSDSDGSSGSGGSDAPGSHPSATENEGDAHRIVENLVHDASERANELYEDPSVVDDPTSNRLERLLALYTPDNTFPEAIEEHVRLLADDGVSYAPGPRGFHERLRVFDLTTIDDDTVRFQYCAALSIEIVGSDLEDPFLAELRTGVGEAHRIDGTWLLYDLVTPTEPREWDPERLTPDECDHMALEQLEQIIDVTDPELFGDPAGPAADDDTGDTGDTDDAGGESGESGDAADESNEEDDE